MVVDRSYYRTSTGADSSYLRGQANAHYVDDDATTTTATALRLLYENNASSNNADGKSFTIMLTVLVALILVFFVICTYQVLRIWLCKCLCGRDYLQGTNSNAAVAAAGAASGSRDTTTMLVHDGRVFNLTGRQRRAVLEAIFSETSKVRSFVFDHGRGQVLGWSRHSRAFFLSVPVGVPDYDPVASAVEIAKQSHCMF